MFKQKLGVITVLGTTLPLLLLTNNSLQAATVTDSGFIPLDSLLYTYAYAGTFTLNAHPLEGITSDSLPNIDDQELYTEPHSFGPDEHGTTGSASFSIQKVLQEGSPGLSWSLTATISPGIAPNLPVSTRSIASIFWTNVETGQGDFASFQVIAEGVERIPEPMTILGTGLAFMILPILKKRHKQL